MRLSPQNPACSPWRCNTRTPSLRHAVSQPDLAESPNPAGRYAITGPVLSPRTVAGASHGKIDYAATMKCSSGKPRQGLAIAAPAPGSGRWPVGLRHRRNPGTAPRPQNIPGHLPHAVRSSRATWKASGLRWISLMWLGQVPWAGRYWALPFLTVLAPSAELLSAGGRRHKKLTDWPAR